MGEGRMCHRLIALIYRLVQSYFMRKQRGMYNILVLMQYIQSSLNGSKVKPNNQKRLKK